MSKKLPHTFPHYVIYGFFFIGLVSALAFRSIIVIERLEPEWVRPVWYLGVLGYIGFFLYRYWITKKRKRAVKDFKLIEKIQGDTCLSPDEREVVVYLLSSIRKSREDINYLVIFILSVVAVLTDIFFVLYTR
jgi:hypothetical protein